MGVENPHLECNGQRYVVGFDGVARVSPMDAGQEHLPEEKRDSTQRVADELRHQEELRKVAAEKARLANPEERVKDMLKAFKITKEDLQAFLSN